MNLSDLDQLVSEGYLKRQDHPSGEFILYDYTDKTQYDGYWTELTLMCRGLILDKEGNIVSRPFGKFFNYSELQAKGKVPSGDYKVYEKLDGSLGISYYWNGNWWLSTRGSFSSDQAILGTGLLQTTYKELLPKMNPKLTYLFEIIYPENRIVVDYKGESKLVLLSVRDTEGNEFPSVEGFPVPESYDVTSFEELSKKNWTNHEGFVCVFESGERMKIKHEEYVRLHAIVTGLTTYTVWEAFRSVMTTELLSKVPDELYGWVKKEILDLIKKGNDITDICVADFKAAGELLTGPRKELAEYFKTCKYPGLLFSLYDGKDIWDKVCLMIKPEFRKPTYETNTDEGSPRFGEKSLGERVLF